MAAVKDELESTATALSRQFLEELQQLRTLQEQAGERREEKIGQTADDHKELLSKILMLQALSEQERSNRRKFLLRFVVGPGGILATLTAITMAYLNLSAPPETKAEDVRQRVEKAEEKVTQTIENEVGEIERSTNTKIEEIERSTELNNKKIQRLVDIQLNQQVQWTEASDYIVDKIEKAHPKTKSIKAPESLQEGRRRAEAIKTKQKKDYYDPADPFSDLIE